MGWENGHFLKWFRKSSFSTRRERGRQVTSSFRTLDGMKALKRKFSQKRKSARYSKELQKGHLVKHTKWTLEFLSEFPVLKRQEQENKLAAWDRKLGLNPRIGLMCLDLQGLFPPMFGDGEGNKMCWFQLFECMGDSLVAVPDVETIIQLVCNLGNREIIVSHVVVSYFNF